LWGFVGIVFACAENSAGKEKVFGMVFARKKMYLPYNWKKMYLPSSPGI